MTDRLREAAQMALEALTALLPDKDDANHDGYDARDVRRWRNTAEALRAALDKSDTQLTHSADCYKWHHQCAIAMIERAALAEKVEPVASDHEACPSHCCPNHGCKYGSDDCPVVAGSVRPEYAHNNGCEDCEKDPPADPDTKLVRLTREQHNTLCFLVDEIPIPHIREPLLALLGDWPAQEDTA